MLDRTPPSLTGSRLTVSGSEFTLELAQPTGPLLDHFPGSVLVPGFMQVDWIAAILRSHFEISEITSVTDIKFLAPIRPPTTIHGEIRIDPHASTESAHELQQAATLERQARFTLRSSESGAVYSKGSLTVV